VAKLPRRGDRAATAATSAAHGRPPEDTVGHQACSRLRGGGLAWGATQGRRAPCWPKPCPVHCRAGGPGHLLRVPGAGAEFLTWNLPACCLRRTIDRRRSEGRTVRADTGAVAGLARLGGGRLGAAELRPQRAEGGASGSSARAIAFRGLSPPPPDPGHRSRRPAPPMPTSTGDSAGPDHLPNQDPARCGPVGVQPHPAVAHVDRRVQGQLARKNSQKGPWAVGRISRRLLFWVWAGASSTPPVCGGSDQ